MTDPLARKLSFGDAEQIQAVRQLERTTEDTIGKTKYKVAINFSGCFETEVWADDEEHAQELAKDEFDIDRSDVETDYVDVQVISQSV